MQDPQETAGQALLNAKQVQELLHVDRSTVYRMAEDGRLSAVKIGRQWRFPAAAIRALLGDLPTPARPGPSSLHAAGHSPTTTQVALDRSRAVPVLDLASDLLGVMMVATDMDGRPLTEVVNPCPWFAARLSDPYLIEDCAVEWQDLADDPDLEPRFHTGRLGFDCARAFVRSGSQLVGMVLAGGIAPRRGDGSGPDPAYPGLYHLDDAQRQRVLNALPRVAAALSSVPARDERTIDGRKAS